MQPLNTFEEQVAAMVTGDTSGENLGELSSEQKSALQVDIKEVRSIIVL